MFLVFQRLEAEPYLASKLHVSIFHVLSFTSSINSLCLNQIQLHVYGSIYRKQEVMNVNSRKGYTRPNNTGY